MKLFLNKISQFLIICFIAIIAFTLLWAVIIPHYKKDNFHYGMISNSFLFNRIKEVEQTKNIDIAFFGTSQTYRGIDPRIFKKHNIQIFNLGSSNQTPLQTELMVKRYLSNLNPKIVILEINPENLSMDGVESTLDFNIHSKIDRHAFSLVIRVNHIKTWLNFIYCGFRQICKLDADFIHPKVVGKDKYINGGYVEKQQDTFLGKKYIDSVNWKPRKYQLKAFARVVELLKQQSATIFLVQMPIEQSLYQMVKDKKAFASFYESFGLPIYNYSKIFPLNHEFFYDNFHLNQAGVDTFNNDLIQRLKLIQEVNVNK